MTQHSSRHLAYDTLEQVDRDDGYANLILTKRLAQTSLSAADRAFVTELVAGTLRLRGRYDAIIERAAARDLTRIDERLHNVLRLGAHQLLELSTPPHAAINEQVELAKQVAGKKTAGFVNGVLRTISRTTREDWLAQLPPAHAAAHPEWIIEVLTEALNDDGFHTDPDTLAHALAANNVPPKVQLALLQGAAQAHEEPRLRIDGPSPLGAELVSGNPGTVIRDLQDQGIYARVQDQGSQLAALALTRARPVRPGERWMDVCAGPGGKTAVLAWEAHPHGATVHANEVAPHRAKLVRDSVRDAPAEVDVITHDGRTDAAYGGQRYDRILVDAPCTGLGALRRRPEARWRKRASDVPELTRLQEELLEHAVAHLASGGVIAYVTCSPHPAETTQVVNRILTRHPHLGALNTREVLDQVARLPLDWGDREDPYAQLWPHRDGTDAMFIALITHSEA